MIASGRKLGQGRVHPALPGKAAGMADHIMKLRQDQPRLAHEALKIAFTQIFGQGFADLPLVFLHGGIQFFEIFYTKRYRKGRAAVKIGALKLKNLLNIQKDDLHSFACGKQQNGQETALYDSIKRPLTHILNLL